jgi:hypothetical protein
LIWNIGWKTAIYTLVALIVHYLEHLYEYWKEAPSLAAANQKLLADLNWPHFWADLAGHACRHLLRGR